MLDALDALSFNRINEKLASFTLGDKAKKVALSLKPLPLEELQSELAKLREAKVLIERFGPFPLESSSDLEEYLLRVKKDGILTPLELHRIDLAVTLLEKCRVYFLNPEVEGNLKEQVLNSPNCLSLSKRIESVISPSLEILDSASPTLRGIRHALIRLRNEEEKKLKTLLKQYEAYLSSPTYSLKNGHYALPFKNTYKNKIPGLLLDISSSGETSFIEPGELLEIENEIEAKKSEEKEEIHRLLLSLSTMVSENGESLSKINQTVAELDLLEAKCLYGEVFHGHIPSLIDSHELYFPKARHPFIPYEKAVPNDLGLSLSSPALLISGPNAGGKSVALKTVGLLCLMALSGLMLPTAEGAFLPYIHKIYTDIGDSQSILENLSTFSGHMSNLSFILKNAKKDDLVIIDELGTGTSPKEGEAIAYSATETLLDKGCFLLLSSHFDSLKKLPLSDPRIKNAAMAFDLEKMEPTYVLLKDSFGKSYGLEVAKRYGLDESTLSRASKILTSSENNQYEKAVASLEESLSKSRQQEEENARQSQELQKKEKELESAIKRYQSAEAELKKSIAIRSDEAISSAIKEAEEILASLNKDGLKPHEVIKAKKDLEGLLSKRDETVFAETAKVGDYVNVPSYGLSGRVAKDSGKQIEVVDSKGFSFWLRKNQAIVISSPKEEEVEGKDGAYLDKSIGVGLPLELNIIGLHVDEASLALEKYLDNCRIRGYKNVRIIHGLGSGALRNMTHNYLKKHPEFVDSYTLGGEYDGGGGATVVKLK